MNLIMSEYWTTLALLVASLPFLGIGTYTSTTFCLPIQPAKGIPHSFGYSASLVAIGVVLYVITIPTYLHIFLRVRRSGNRVGVTNDGKLAKKISIIIGIQQLHVFSTPNFYRFCTVIHEGFRQYSSDHKKNSRWFFYYHLFQC